MLVVDGFHVISISHTSMHKACPKLGHLKLGLSSSKDCLSQVYCTSWPTATFSLNFPTLVGLFSWLLCPWGQLTWVFYAQCLCTLVCFLLYSTMQPVQEQGGIYFSRKTLVSTSLLGIDVHLGLSLYLLSWFDPVAACLWRLQCIHGFIL